MLSNSLGGQTNDQQIQIFCGTTTTNPVVSTTISSHDGMTFLVAICRSLVKSQLKNSFIESLNVEDLPIIQTIFLCFQNNDRYTDLRPPKIRIRRDFAVPHHNNFVQVRQAIQS